MAVADLMAGLFGRKEAEADGGPPPPGPAAPEDPFAITPDRIRCLTALRVYATRYVQRFVEQLSFCENGGQRWTRIFQIQIPEPEDGAGAELEPSWWIVPLGPFTRSRFPDFEVRDGGGARVPLLTRDQHGVALTKMLLTVCLEGVGAETFERGDARYEQLHRRLVEFYTDNRNLHERQRVGDSADGESELEKEVTDITREFEDLLEAIGAGDDESREKAVQAFANDLAGAATTTHYLCWVQARPRQLIHLESSHSIRDPRHRLPYGNLWGTVKAIWEGLIGVKRRRSPEAEPGRRWLYDRTARRQRWVGWYRQFGLVPINYEFNIPTHEDTRSYYSTLQAPDHTTITFVDWEEGNSDDPESEVDCALPSVHIAKVERDERAGSGDEGDDDGSGDEGDVDGSGDEGDRSPSPEDRTQSLVIRAYLRCVPHHHKQILGAAALNIIIVWLLASGRLPGELGDPLQGLLIAAPSVLVAYLVRQQRHYYAHALRRSRAILWGYLVVGVLFLVAVAFSEGAGHAGSESLGWAATTAAWTLAITSAAILAWYFPLGHAYDRVVIFFFHQKQRLIDPELKAREGPFWARVNGKRRRLWRNGQLEGKDWRCYEAAYELYARIIWLLVILAAIGAAGILLWRWHYPSEGAPLEHHARAVMVERPSAPRSAGAKPGSPMRLKGVEPSRALAHTDLNRARLPVPPQPRDQPIYRLPPAHRLSAPAATAPSPPPPLR